MNAKVLRLLVAAVCILAIAQAAVGHENQTFRIGKQVYKLTVGSLNEPVAVDDKTGLDFKVEIEPGPGAKPGPVAGLEQTLKVEVAAGAKKKVFNLQSSFGTPGSYKTSFYPTVQTTFSYRIFGTIENVPVNLTFTCSPAGHARVPEDTTEVKISDQVTRLSKRGSFGCPVAKADVGFPEAAPSVFELQAKVSNLDSALAGAQSQAGTARWFGVAGLVVGLAGFAIGMAAWMNGRSNGTANGRTVQSNTPRRKM